MPQDDHMPERVAEALERDARIYAEAGQDDGREWDDEAAGAVAFVGHATSPLFLNAPLGEETLPVLGAFEDLDVEAAAQGWPFVDDDARARVRDALGRIRGGAALTHVPFEGDHPLSAAYRNLIAGPADLMAPPWGSVYTDHDMVTDGLTTMLLKSWMKVHGITMMSASKVPPDHIGLMLQLMAQLALERSGLLDAYLREHFLTWAPHYLEVFGVACEREAARELPASARYTQADHVLACGLYAGLADLTAVSLEGIRRCRGLEVTEPRFYR